MSDPNNPASWLAYGAPGILALVLLGAGKIVHTLIDKGLSRMLDQQEKANEKLADSLGGLHAKIDDGIQELHVHISDSERRITSEVQGRKPTPPPMKAYRGPGGE